MNYYKNHSHHYIKDNFNIYIKPTCILFLITRFGYLITIFYILVLILLKKVMNSIKINFTPSRPRFSVEIPFTREEMHERFKKILEAETQTYQGIINSERAIVRLRKDRDQYWHPQLSLRIEQEDGKTYLNGLFGPHPNVWTFFMFLYGLGTSLILFIGMYGLVELTMGKSSYFIWFNALGLFIIITTYIASKIGQEYSKEHTKSMIKFLKKALR